MAKERLFPNRRNSNRSCYFEVKPGEVAMFCGFFPPCMEVSMCVNKVHEDKCRCIHLEKEFCQLGDQAGVSDEACEGMIVMPGKYVAILEYDPCIELPDEDEWGIYVDVAPALPNIQTLAQIASIGVNKHVC